MTKILSIFLALWFAAAAPLSADVYMKNNGMNGMAEMETWTSGKKQRMSARMPMVLSRRRTCS